MANRWIFTVKEGTGVTGLFPVGMKPEVVIDLGGIGESYRSGRTPSSGRTG